MHPVCEVKKWRRERRIPSQIMKDWLKVDGYGNPKGEDNRERNGDVAHLNLIIRFSEPEEKAKSRQNIFPSI